MPAKILYNASKGDLKFLETIVEKLSLLANKDIIIEFISLILGQNTQTKALGNKIGVFEENYETLEALLLFIMAITRYDFQIKPKIISEVKGIDNLTKENVKLYREFIDPIRINLEFSINKLIRTGAIDIRKIYVKTEYLSLKRLIENSINNIKRYSDRDLVLHKNINSLFSKEKIIEIVEIIVEDIIYGNQKQSKDIITSTINFMEFNTTKLKCFQALCQIATSFITDVPMIKIKETPDLYEAFKLTSTILGIGPEYLELFLDIISQSPFRLFNCSTPNPKINIKNFEILGEFDSSRLELLSDITGYSRTDLRKVIAVWMNSFNLISNNKHVFNTLDILKHDFNIDPSLLLLMHKKSSYSNNAKILREIKSETQSFLLKTLHKLKKNVEDDISFVYYDSLTTENLELERNCEFINLSNLDSRNVTIDSPFKQSQDRSKKDALDFIVLLKSIIKLKDGNKKILKKIFGDNNGVKILVLIKNCIKANNLESFLNLLEVISSSILIELKDIQADNKFINKNNNWQNLSIEAHSKSLNSQDKSQWLILQLSFLFCCTKLNEMIVKEANENSKSINRTLDDFFVTINKFIPRHETLIPSQIGLNEIILSMFESSFFNDIAKRIFYNIIPETQAILFPESILGITVGLSLKNMNLVRTSLLTLLGQTKNRVISGLFAILANDPNQEKDIKAISKSLSIKGDLVFNLIDALCMDERRDKYNPLMRICGDYCSSSNIICSIVSVFLEDLSCVRILSEQFEVDHQILSLVLASATRRQDLLRGNYSLLSKKLRINNEEAVEKILELACENEEIISKIDSNGRFYMIDKTLIQMVCYVDRIGRKLSRPHSKFDIPDSSYACRVISDKIKEAFGVSDDLGTIVNGDDENKEFDIAKILKWIINAVWGNLKAINHISKYIQMKSKDPRNMISKIWTKYPLFGPAILTTSLQKLNKAAIDSTFERTSSMKKSIADNQKYLDALFIGKNLNIDLSKEDKNDAEVMKALKDNKKQIAYKVGCTINIVGEYEFCQEYLECDTCKANLDIKDPVRVCLSCAEFCHAGHTLVAPKVQEIRIICDCGYSKHPSIKINENNPLKGIPGFEKITENNCSLIFEGYKEFVKAKQNFTVNKRLLSRYELNENMQSGLNPNTEERKLIEEVKNPHSNSLKQNNGSEETLEVALAAKLPNDEISNHAYYDEAELRDKFREELSSYTSEDFIVDLAFALKFDCRSISINCPDMLKNCFYTYDESLCRYVHLYEHMILLANGFCRPGFIRLLSNYGIFNTVYPNNHDYYTDSYQSFACVVALTQGDFEMYLKYCRNFLIAQGVKEGSGSTYLQKAARLLMLCYSYTHFTESNEISGVRDEYERMLRELFPKNYQAISHLHKLSSLNWDRLVSIFLNKNADIKNAKASYDKELYERCVEGLLIKNLELDNRSVEWTGALVKVCMGEISALDFICKVYNIPSTKVNIYKAICTSDQALVQPLFEAIKDEVPLDLSESIYKLLNGEIDALCDIILRNIYQFKVGMQFNFDNSDIQSNLKRILRNIIELTSSNYIDKEVLTKVINDAGINEDVVNVILGYNAVINEDEYHAHYLLETKDFKDEIGQPKVVKALYELMVYGSECSQEIYETLFESICLSFQLFQDNDRESKFKDWQDKVEMSIIKATLDALNGNMTSLGFVADNILSENKSAICLLFGILSQNEYNLPYYLHQGWSNYYNFRYKLYREIMRFSEKSFSSILNQPEMIEMMYEYDIHILIFLSLSQSYDLTDQICYLYSNFKLIDYNLVYTIFYLLYSRYNYMPSLGVFFEKSKETLEKKFNVQITEENYFQITIKNFKNPNIEILNKAKSLFQSLMSYDMNTIIDEEKRKQFENDYRYEINVDGIKISAPCVFEILFRALRKDSEAIKDIISMMFPLLRDIPGGVMIFNIISTLTKNDIRKLISIMPILVRVMMLSKLNLSENLSEKEIEEKLNQLKFTDSLEEGVAAWISSLVILINKNTAQFELEYFKNIFINMMNTLDKYEDEIGIESKMTKNAMKQANFILMILGFCRGNFEMITTLASELGVFDDKVKELFAIFMKYKEIIFRNGVVGLPPLKKNLIESQLKQGLNLAADQAKRAINDALKQGKSVVADLAQVGATKISKAAKAQMEKLSKIAPKATSAVGLIFADLFSRFDENNNGFINYNEFCELCRYMGLHMDKEKTLKLFSAADRDHDNHLDLREFQLAMVFLKLEIAYDTFKKLGMTTEDLVWFAVLGIIYLLLMFTFIFLGIAAFSKAEGFNSVINSLLPMAAGLAAGARNLDLKAAIENVKVFVEDIMNKIKYK